MEPVSPWYTSQMCSGCGTIVAKSLSVRVHRCDSCGLELDRDVNAARNILALGLSVCDPTPVIPAAKIWYNSSLVFVKIQGKKRRHNEDKKAFISRWLV
ncbi:MAG: transposase [Maribacter sp.]|uniref:zinc ribbon domain-containing protein n=1 Tax=Maribacter sp. TaxID=1897614 RepID=UPI003C71F060